MKQSKASISDEEIYELRNHGMSYQEISSHFDKKGIKIAWSTIRERCKRIYKQKGEEEPKAKYRSKIKRSGVIDEDIYELRNQGMSYREISRYFDKEGKKISWLSIRQKCKKIYKEKGETEPKGKKKSKQDITDDEIYELREQGMIYQEILNHFEKKGKKISRETLRRRCKRIYMEKGKEEPKVKRKGIKRRKYKIDEDIYELREQGMTYEAIAKFYEEKGINISSATIRERCKRIYEQKGEEEPKAKRKKKITRIKKEVLEEIYELREQGMSYESISSYFEKKGIKISRNTIRERCRRIYEEKGKEEPKIKRKGVTDEEIYELREQGMTYQEILNYFEKKGIKISWNTIRQGCKRIYMEKGKEEPKVKRKKYKKGIIDEELYELREQGMSYGDISSYFGKKGIKISWVTIRERCKKIYEKKGKEVPKLKKRRKKQHKTDSESLEALNEELNEKIKKKLEMEKILNTLKDYIERNTEGVEK